MTNGVCLPYYDGILRHLALNWIISIRNDTSRGQERCRIFDRQNGERGMWGTARFSRRQRGLSVCREMICVKTLHLRLNRVLLLVVGLWPYERSKFVELQLILLYAILISFIIFQVHSYLAYFNNVWLLCNQQDTVECYLQRHSARTHLDMCIWYQNSHYIKIIHLLLLYYYIITVCLCV